MGKEGLVFKSPHGGEQCTNIREHIYSIRTDSGIEEFGYHRMCNLAVPALSSQGVDIYAIPFITANIQKQIPHFNGKNLVG